MMLLPLATVLLLQSPSLDEAVVEASAHAATGAWTDAETILRDAGVEQSTHGPALALFGRCFLRNVETRAGTGELAGLEVNDAFLDAADWLEKAVKAGGGTPAFVDWSEALLNAGDARAALEAAAEGREAVADDGPLILQWAHIRAVQAQNLKAMDAPEKAATAWREAADACGEAMDASPGDAVACVRRGENLLWLASVEPEDDLRSEAIRHWTEALARDRAAVDLAAMVTWLGTDAAPLLAACAKDSPDDPMLRWFEGMAWYGAAPRDWKKVRKAFEAVLDLEPSFTNANFFLAQGAFDEGSRLLADEEEKRAGQAFRFSGAKWAKYLGDFGEGHVNDAALADRIAWLVTKSTLKDAVNLLQWLTRARPGDAEAWQNLGFFLRETRKHEESLAAYEKALEIAPEDPQILNDAAVILHYYLKRDDEIALAWYAKAAGIAIAQLESSDLDDDAKARTEVALRDSRTNISRLEKGDRRNR